MFWPRHAVEKTFRILLQPRPGPGDNPQQPFDEPAMTRKLTNSKTDRGERLTFAPFRPTICNGQGRREFLSFASLPVRRSVPRVLTAGLVTRLGSNLPRPVTNPGVGLPTRQGQHRAANRSGGRKPGLADRPGTPTRLIAFPTRRGDAWSDFDGGARVPVPPDLPDPPHHSRDRPGSRRRQSRPENQDPPPCCLEHAAPGGATAAAPLSSLPIRGRTFAIWLEPSLPSQAPRACDPDQCVPRRDAPLRAAALPDRLHAWTKRSDGSQITIPPQSRSPPLRKSSSGPGFVLTIRISSGALQNTRLNGPDFS